jgi:Coenzyme PQQ synthesis protein D (PqqD)
MSGKVWQRDENWVGSQIEDNFVMVNIDTGKYVSLNATASAVWDALEQPKSQDDIEAVLRERFTIDEAACTASVTRLLERMSELQLAEQA